jgi:hypothetical protein
VPLRFPHPAMVPAAIGLAAACVLLGSAPTLADQVRNQEWWLRALNVSQAWRTTEGSGVTVAVLGTGVDPAQPDLAGSVLPGPDFTHSGETARTPYAGGDGTALASLIAGHGHGAGGQSAGIVGVAPGARILSVRVALRAGDPQLADASVAAGLPEAIAAGIRYAVRQGAQVIDLPLDPGAATGPGSPGVTAAAGGSTAERAAIASALRAGAVLVAPAGDDGTAGNAVNYPAAYPGVIAVGAFDQHTLKSPFSVRQRYVTLTAAGDGVIAATPPHGYAVMHSTSAASAIVAGIAALIRSQYPGLTPGQVAKALENGTRFRPNGKTGVGSGYGTADAAGALTAAAALAPSARRAGTGAVPHVLPSVPPAAAAPLTKTAKVEQDALISGAVLVLLLLPVIALAGVRRREDRSPAGAHDGRDRARYAEDADIHGEPPLGYLAAPASRAIEAPGTHAASSHRHSAGHAGAGLDSLADGGHEAIGRGPRSLRVVPAGADAEAEPGVAVGAGGFAMSSPRAGLSRTGKAPGRLPAPGQPGGPGELGRLGGPGAPGSLGTPGQGGPSGPLSGLDASGSGGFTGSSSFTGPSPRAGTPDRPSATGQVPPGPVLAPVARPTGTRLPKISGSPPWEPAVKPDGELPWANVPAPQPISGREPRLPPDPAPRSVWDVAAPAPAEAAADDAGDAGDAVDADDGWNPGAATETFPAIPGNQD